MRLGLPSTVFSKRFSRCFSAAAVTEFTMTIVSIVHLACSFSLPSYAGADVFALRLARKHLGDPNVASLKPVNGPEFFDFSVHVHEDELVVSELFTNVIGDLREISYFVQYHEANILVVEAEV